jgi:hypothetical protein
MSTIFFGPWIGEFGYELSYWIGECRAIREKYPNHEAIASSYYGRSRLYDFADIYLPHDTNSIYSSTNTFMAHSTGIVLHPDAGRYARDSDVRIRPAQNYEGLILGGDHGHSQIQKSVDFQKIKKLTASEQALQTIKDVSKGRPIVSLLCRNLFLENKIHAWPESKWEEIARKFDSEGYCTILLLAEYPSKPNFLNSTSISLWKLFGNAENFVDLQIACLNLSACMVTTVCGAVMLGYLTETPTVYLLASQNEYFRLHEVWRSRYNQKLKYLFGKDDVDKISVQQCHQEALGLIDG